MDPAVQAVGGLRIDGVSVQNQAPERRLDVAARAAEPIVEIEMAKGGIEIVAPQQADHAAAKPDAFRVAGWPAQGALGFGEFVDLLRFFAGSWPAAGGFSAGLELLVWAGAWEINTERSQSGTHSLPATLSTRRNMVRLVGP